MNIQRLTAFFIISLALLFVSLQADPIPVANHSFENPATEYVTPIVSGWEEIDLDEYSQNTGAFLNVPGDPLSFIINAEGNQVAFLIAQEGNAFQQDLSEVYQVGKSYQLIIQVGISYYSPPEDPSDSLELVFYYKDENQQVHDIALMSIPFQGRGSTILDHFTLNLPIVKSGYAWAEKNIGIAMRGRSDLGGTWIIDNVQVEKYPSVPNFTDDSVVNLPDFAKMAGDWLLCGQVTTDVTGEGCVNEADLLILAEYWLDDV